MLSVIPQPRLVGHLGATIADATLYEIFPGSEWAVLAGHRLPKKSSAEGRRARAELLSALGIRSVPDLPTPDQNDALVGDYVAWCTRNDAGAVTLKGHPPVFSGSEIREGYILHSAGTTAKAKPVPRVTNEPASKAETVAEAEDWASDDDLSLKVTDYGVVHGNCPENNWLEAHKSYRCEAVSPDTTEQFDLLYAPHFSGGQGWKAKPTVMTLLRKLGYVIPRHLGDENAVTLRIRTASTIA